MKEFVHLHVHTHYSLLDSTIRFDRLFARAKEYDMNACAITDHCNMFGAVDFYFEAKKAGIKPIIGCEIHHTPNSRFKNKTTKDKDHTYHIVLLAMDDRGYRNLMKLVSLACTGDSRHLPYVERDSLQQYNEGLICLTGCEKGEIPSAILANDEQQAEMLIGEYHDIFQDRLYIELQNNNLVEQRLLNEKLIGLADCHRIPCVATNNCHYLNREEARAHQLLQCLSMGKTMNDKDHPVLRSDQFHFRSAQEMEVPFYMHPEALSNTVEIAERCNVSIDDGTWHFPDMGFNDNFEQLSRYGFEKRLPAIRANCGESDEAILGQYKARLDYEISIIKKAGFSKYFLIVADVIHFAKTHDIPVGPGRGSAPGSLVNFCLGITDVDPIKYDLTFERFLNPEHIHIPHIHVDFCRHKRDEVIRYATEKYGEDHVAQVVTFATMTSRFAVKDIGRAMGMPYWEVDKIANLIISTDRDIENAINEEPQINELYRTSEQVKDLLDNAIVIEGLVRHASTHAADTVIADNLSEYVPLYRGQHDEIVTQYNMAAVERVGLITFDFLGLKTLTLIDSTIKLLKNEGIDVDIANIPLDDAKTYDLLSSGNTKGIFQLESPGMKKVLRRYHPERFSDIMALIALYRPGPTDCGMVDEFIKRKRHPDRVVYEMPLLESILKDTYGIIIYQEQIMKIASALANFSLKDADILRRIVSIKRSDQLSKYRARFIQGAKSNCISRAMAGDIYDLIARWGEHTFMKAHCAAYGLIAYQTVYLKANYPEYFSVASKQIRLSSV